MDKKVSDIMFSTATRAIQKKQGYAEMINNLETRDYWKDQLSDEQISFIQGRDSFYLGSASKKGRPYIQHRGGSKGFILVENVSTIWFPDFSGNKQYISVGNFSENNQAFIFFMDYYRRRRLKLWGKATAHEIKDFPQETLEQPSATVTIERVIKFEIQALDENCFQHIPRRVSEEEYLEALQRAKQEIAKLKQRIEILEG